MRKITLSVLSLCLLSACGGTMPAGIGGLGRYVVAGVEEGDMLKLRGGPGVGFDIYAGLPNGTIVRAQSCERLGSTRWCRVAVERSPSLTGYVSEAYLRKL